MLRYKANISILSKRMCDVERVANFDHRVRKTTAHNALIALARTKKNHLKKLAFNDTEDVLSSKTDEKNARTKRC